MAVLFDGNYLVTPTVQSTVNDDAMYPEVYPSGNTLVLLGESLGGEPKTALRLRSAYQARQVLKGGELYEAVLRAFNPGATLGSPWNVYAVRVNPATQAAATIKDSGNAAVINLKSTDYGAQTNTLAYRLEASQDGHSWILSVRQDETVYTRSGLGAEVFTLVYAGTSPATANWKIASGKLTIEAPNLTTLKEYTLAHYTSAAALVEAMDADLNSDWTVTLIPGSEKFVPAYLDKKTVADAKVSATATGHTYAIGNFINSNAEIYLDATFADDFPLNPPVAAAWTALTGGTDYGLGSSTTTADWEDGLEATAEMEASWIVPVTSTEAVWDLVAAHVEYMSDRKRERRAFVGGPTGLTAAQAANHALGINSDRVGYVWPGVYDYDRYTRRLTLLPPYMAAVQVAAGFATMNPGTTMSRKPLAVVGAEVKLIEPTDTDTLLEAGVIPLVQSDKGTLVSQAVSTWRKDDRYNRREISVGAAVDYVARAARENLEMLLGERASWEVMPRAKSRLESILSSLAVPPPIGPGILVGDAINPPFRNIVIEIEGDVLTASFECSPVIPINYILIPITVTPYRGTLRAE